MTTNTSEICVRIMGGLGNQMFQYAAGHALARRHGSRLLVDLVGSSPSHAVMGLDLFGIEPEIWQAPPARGLGRFLRRRRKAKQSWKAWPGPVFRQDNFCSVQGFADLGPGTYLQGYFQSESFFADCAAEIRTLFDLGALASTIDPEILDLARQPQTVSVHIRRGDYIKDPKTTAVHGVLGDDHYARAYELMNRLVPGCQWLVFSDEPEAAEQLTRTWTHRTVVAGHTREQDLYLMTQCAHHVIANSSFSWWGAWLGRNPARQVIAPRCWMSRQEMHKTYVDGVCPVGWILL